MDAFSKFISEDVITLIIEQTNIYGKQRCIEKGEGRTNWKEVDRNQLNAFLGILFIMGFHKLPRIRDYWS
jgi:Transposase IS4